MKHRLEKNDGARGGHSSAGAGGDGGGVVGYPRNRENEQLVIKLQRYNTVLQRENIELKAKVKVSSDGSRMLVVVRNQREEAICRDRLKRHTTEINDRRGGCGKGDMEACFIDTK